MKNRPLGLIETMVFKELGPVPAKVDSGNGAYNVLHGVNIEMIDDQTVQFDTVNNKTIHKPVIELIDINVGSGNIEQRPVVEFNIQIGNKKFNNVKFSIGDRTDNEYKILVGKDFISLLGGVIDVDKVNNLS